MTLAKAHSPIVSTRMIQSRALLALGIPVCLALLVLLMMLHILFGAADIAPHDVLQSFTAFDNENTSHLVIRTVRFPRVFTAVTVGAALAIAGAIIQGLTRNRLADPGLLGIESGAVLAVVLAIYFLHITSASHYASFAIVGAAITGVVVYGLGSMGRSGATPAKLTIAGAAVTSLVGSITTVILLFSNETVDQIRFWLAGSVSGRDFSVLWQVMPYFIVGFAIALLLARQITTLSMGEDVARGLGQNVFLIQSLSALSVMLLAGASAAMTGAIGFVGLVIPHISRSLVGVDYRWILPYSGILGAMLLVGSDIVARLIARPIELPVGIMTALVGAPLFIYLARTKGQK